MKEIDNLILQIKESLDDLRILFKEYISTKEIKRKQNEEIQKKDGIYINDSEQKVIVNGYSRQLTYSEYLMMCELLQNIGRTCTYQELSKAVYGYNLDQSSKRSIISCISRLRSKTEGLLEIKNIRNIGFALKEVQINARTD